MVDDSCISLIFSFLGIWIRPHKYYIEEIRWRTHKYNIKTLEHNGYTLNMWDVSGQQSLRSYWRS